LFGRVSSTQLAPEADSAEVNPFTNRIYVGESSSGQIAIIDGKTDQQIGTIAPSGGSGSGVIDLVHERLFISDFNGGDVEIIDTRPNK